jgi:hypothetical protein
MADYRFYCLDGDGRIGLADWIVADTDEQAIARAHEMRPAAHKCEIWLETRLVAKINSSGHVERVSA